MAHILGLDANEQIFVTHTDGTPALTGILTDIRYGYDGNELDDGTGWVTLTIRPVPES